MSLNLTNNIGVVTNDIGDTTNLIGQAVSGPLCVLPVTNSGSSLLKSLATCPPYKYGRREPPVKCPQ
ncbi:MAG: hypothetical protein GY869_08270 [Planctomycetes bacterium]|nr:hypothetical protein [Planctomycetota bacterium]